MCSTFALPCPHETDALLQTKKPRDYDSKERELDWEASNVADLRDTLLVTAKSLSEEWKKEKTAKEEQKKKETAESNGVAAPEDVVIPDSDDEIIVGEVVTKPGIKKGAGKGKQPVKTRKSEGDAMRLR